jgi:hypothetical protein
VKGTNTLSKRKYLCWIWRWIKQHSVFLKSLEKSTRGLACNVEYTRWHEAPFGSYVTVSVHSDRPASDLSWRVAAVSKDNSSHKLRHFASIKLSWRTATSSSVNAMSTCQVGHGFWGNIVMILCYYAISIRSMSQSTICNKANIPILSKVLSYKSTRLSPETLLVLVLQQPQRTVANKVKQEQRSNWNIKIYWSSLKMTVNAASNHMPNLCRDTCKWLQDLWLPCILVRVGMEYQYSGPDAVSLLGGLTSQQPSNARRILLALLDPGR